jgi:Tol biopolymer transport system component/DNA-binding winged helix-turn-helix (wHTH) protein
MPAEVYEFGDVTVDLRRVEVRRAGEVVALEPKSFDVLRYLVENADRLVTKDELLDAVWRDTFVTPNVLTRAVAQLRRGLGDDASEPRYIETASKRGYRFIAPIRGAGDGLAGAVAAEQPPRPELAAPSPPPGRRRWILPAAGLAAVAMLGAAALWFTARHRAAPAGQAADLTPRRLTVANDAFGTPSISPDGSTVAYVSRRTGTHEIVVAGLAAGSRQVPITNDGGENVQPAFSPDGQWLAYHSSKRNGIWVVPSTGGAPMRVVDFGSEPAWSPDGQTIVFSSQTGLSSQSVLWTVRRDGGSPVQLTRAGEPPGGHAAPAWSHDGRFIAFKVGRHEERDIWIMKASGGQAWRLFASDRNVAPVFSPDDRAMYWMGRTADRNDGLMRVRLTAEGLADGSPEVVLPFTGEGVSHFSVSRNGTAVFHWQRLSANLFAIDIDARGEGGQPVPLTFDTEAVNTAADYSPDGRVAFEQVVAGRPNAAWVMDDRGRNVEPLSTGLSVSVRSPQWDADGTRVFVFVEPGAKERSYFAWMDIATRQLSRIPIPSSGGANWPSLSPDGQRLAFHLIAPDGVLNVWVQRLDDGSQRQITFDREAASYPRWSQDGRWLAVNLKRGRADHVGVVPADGGPLEQLTTGNGIRWPYSFAPDNDRIAFSGEFGNDPVRNIYSVSRRTREVKQLTRFTAGGSRFPAWSPRGDRIVFTRGEFTRSLWTMKLP